MLAGAVVSVPYFAYYQLMNWAVVGAAAVTAWQAYKQNKEWVAWVMALVAAVFNPIAPLYLRADVWLAVDIAAMLIFALSFILIRSRR